MNSDTYKELWDTIKQKKTWIGEIKNITKREISVYHHAQPSQNYMTDDLNFPKCPKYSGPSR